MGWGVGGHAHGKIACVMLNLAGRKRKLLHDTDGKMAENLLKRISSGLATLESFEEKGSALTTVGVY
eukprot:5044973-Prorocentrum_lima.AAC.1